MNQQTQTDLGLTVQLDRPAIDGSPDHESISIPRFFSKQCVGPLIFELVQTGWQLLFLDIGWPLSRKLNSVWFNQAVIFNFNYDFLKKHNFSRNSRWPFQGQNDQFSKNFVKFRKITELEKVIYLCASWPYTHHYTSLNAKVTLDFRNFHKIFYHLVTQKLRQNLYKKYFIFKICYEKHFYCSLYDGGGIVGSPVGPVIAGPGRPV